MPRGLATLISSGAALTGTSTHMQVHTQRVYGCEAVGCMWHDDFDFAVGLDTYDCCDDGIVNDAHDDDDGLRCKHHQQRGTTITIIIHIDTMQRANLKYNHDDDDE